MTDAGNLPPTTTRVLGRRELIERIERELDGSRLVSIVGAGGIGKTTVALAVAELAAEAFGDGVRFVDLAPVREPSLVANAVAAAIGLVVHSASVITAVARFLRDRTTLLVLDNCEHLRAAVAACVVEILAAGSNVRVLATSRTPLGVGGEQIHRLPGLAAPPADASPTAAEALAYPAIELFVERATDRLESFVLRDADVPVVADICRNLDGIALAIELAAMRVDVFGVRGLQQQLDDRFRVLGKRRAGLERHRTLTATLDWSYGLVPVSEAAVLCAVSVFAGGLRRGDAVAVSGLPADETARILTELAAQSLLAVDADAGEVTYRPLETTRAYCLGKLAASGDEPVVRRRHAEHICAVVERAAADLAPGPARGYLDDLRGALAWAGADPAQAPLLIRLTSAGVVLWNHFSLTDESRGHLRRALAALDAAGATGTDVEMTLQVALAGATLYTRGIVPEARAAMDRALAIAVQRSDTGYQLSCLRLIATYELFSGRNAAGIQTLETFVAMATAHDPAAVAEGETHLGCAELFNGRLRAARERLERLYGDGLQDLDDATAPRFLHHHSISILVVLSHAQWLTGSPAAAAHTARRVVDYGLAAHHELSLTIGVAWACLVFYWAGLDEECRRHTAMLDDLVERHGIVTWRPVAWFCRGALACRDAATRAEGIEDLERAVAECRAIGHLARLPYYSAVLAEALARHGRIADAEALIGEALALAETGNDNWSLPELVRIQAFVAGAAGRPAEHEALLGEAVALAERLGATSWQLRAAIDLAGRWRTRVRASEARQVLEPVLARFTDGHELRDVATAARLLDELE
jgi:predicted ATPase